MLQMQPDRPAISVPQLQPSSELDIGTFLRAAGETPYYTLFHQALFTGMRRSELLALR